MDKMVMRYKLKYVDLANTLNYFGCVISDHDFLGHCSRADGKKAFIYIKPRMSYKHKYYTLIHEAGHLFYTKKTKIFNWSKKDRTEDQANKFALQYLKLMDLDTDDYILFYQKAKKRNKHRRKSWFEI